jgi:hypothetical protein
MSELKLPALQLRSVTIQIGGLCPPEASPPSVVGSERFSLDNRHFRSRKDTPQARAVAEGEQRDRDQYFDQPALVFCMRPIGQAEYTGLAQRNGAPALPGIRPPPTYCLLICRRDNEAIHRRVQDIGREIWLDIVSDISYGGKIAEQSAKTWWEVAGNDRRCLFKEAILFQLSSRQ